MLRGGGRRCMNEDGRRRCRSGDSGSGRCTADGGRRRGGEGAGMEMVGEDAEGGGAVYGDGRRC